MPHLTSIPSYSSLLLCLSWLIPTVVRAQCNSDTDCPVPYVTFTYPVPSPTYIDFEQKFETGQTISVAWTADTSWNGSTVDLWLTWAKSDDYTVLFEQDITLRTPGTYSWTIDINSTILNNDNRFVLRLKPHIDSTDPQYLDTLGFWGIYSLGFIVAQGDTQSSASSTATISSAISSAAATATSTGPSASALPSNDGDSGLSTGAKAGIGVGAAVAGIALFVGGFLFARRNNKKKREGEAAQMGYAMGKQEHQPPQYSDDGSRNYGRYEMSTDNAPRVQPARHELQ